MISPSMFEDLGFGITRIDTGYLVDGCAACYLLLDQGEAALIDTGVNGTLDRVKLLLAAENIPESAIKYVIPTHVHLDHAGGAGRMMAAFPHAQLVIHPRGARHMIAPEKLVAGAKAVYGEQRFAELYGEILPIEEYRVIIAEDGFALPLGNRQLLFRHSPGHANHHFVIWDEVSAGWFSGDTFGVCYPAMVGAAGQTIFPTTTPVQFNPEQLAASIAMMMAVAPRFAYLTHFGRVSNLPALAEQLKDKIHRYCELTRQLVNTDNPQQQLAEALMALELQCLKEVMPDFAEQDARALLAMDMELNAQGLLHWAQHV
jgi:glyoxylase-like metal-dependent hydrolase (beta-lactamase superfamily II)